MNYRVTFITTTMNWVVLGAVISSFALYIIGLGVYCQMDTFDPYMYGVAGVIATTPLFWVGALVVPLMAMMLDSFKAYLMLSFLPNRSDLILELASEGKLRDCPLPVDESFATGEPDSNIVVTAAGLESQVSSSTPLAAPVPKETMSPRVAPSFHFDHPETSPRAMFASHRHPTAGDTSLLDVLDQRSQGTRSRDQRSQGTRSRIGTGESTSSSGSEEDGAEDGDVLHQNRPIVTSFNQQQLRSYNFVLSSWRLVNGAVVVGAVLGAVGAMVLHKSNNVVQIRVQYSGEPRSHWDIRPEALIHHDCPSGTGLPCDVTVTVPDDMHPPILAVYSVDPFFQNYYFYQQSVIFDELRGKQVPPALRKSVCQDIASRSVDGEPIYPCGLMATSMFNDTVEQPPDEHEARRQVWEPAELRRSRCVLVV